MASRGVNKVILLGNVGANPEVRTFQNGDLVANFSLATSESWNDKMTGQERERTEWHRCVAYRGLAGVIQRFVRKGSKLFIEGRLQTRKWNDQNGIERYTTEIIVDNMQMLDSRGGSTVPFDDSSSFENNANFRRGGDDYGQNNNHFNYDRENEGRRLPQQYQQNHNSNTTKQEVLSDKEYSNDRGFSDTDEDIPF